MAKLKYWIVMVEKGKDARGRNKVKFECFGGYSCSPFILGPFDSCDKAWDAFAEACESGDLKEHKDDRSKRRKK